jgi:hypothetical protein
MSHEASSSATIRVPRTFDWNSHDAAKREFEEMYAVLRQCMGERCWVLDEEQTKTFMPSDLPQAPARNADAEVKEAYETKKEKHDEKLNVIYRAFYYGHAVLRCLFPYGSMVRRDIDAAIDSPPAGTARADWTSVKAFRAAIKILKEKYSMQTITDSAQLRTMLTNLTDEISGGFYEYQRQFNQILSQLRGTGDAGAITDAELRELIKKGIRNKEIFTSVTGRLYTEQPDISYSTVFEKINSWLQLALLAGIDPYATAHSSRGTITAAAASRNIDGSSFKKVRFSSGGPGQSGGNFCTKCWSTGHGFRVCTSIECAICRTDLTGSDRSCPRWRDHPDPRHRFYNDVPPWERSRAHPNNKPIDKNNKRKLEQNERSAPRPRPSTDAPATKSATQAAFKAQRKELKKAYKAMRVAARAERENEEEA